VPQLQLLQQQGLLPAAVEEDATDEELLALLCTSALAST
jgi:hypothetical protein